MLPNWVRHNKNKTKSKEEIVVPLNHPNEEKSLKFHTENASFSVHLNADAKIVTFDVLNVALGSSHQNGTHVAFICQLPLSFVSISHWMEKKREQICWKDNMFWCSRTHRKQTHSRLKMWIQMCCPIERFQMSVSTATCSLRHGPKKNSLPCPARQEKSLKSRKIANMLFSPWLLLNSMDEAASEWMNECIHKWKYCHN